MIQMAEIIEIALDPEHNPKYLSDMLKEYIKQQNKGEEQWDL